MEQYVIRTIKDEARNKQQALGDRASQAACELGAAEQM